MMAGYIGREALQAALARKRCGVANQRYTEGWNDCLLRVKSMVSKFPAADVAPVVHGRWEVSTDEWFETDVYTCSKCRESYVLVEGTPKENLWRYCPNCGAKMDENWKQTT